MARARNARPSGKSQAKKESNQVGRPSDFKPEFCEQAEKLCRLGATDEELAAFFDKDVATINRWKHSHPEFRASVKEGKVLADINVANSLYKRATGYVLETEKVVGKGENQRVVKLSIAVEADTTAAIFWLKNRRKDHWRDKQDHEHHVYNHEDALDELE
jgi:hypothetical protein